MSAPHRLPCLRLAWACFVSALVGACSPAPIPVSRDASIPSNPHAKESPVVVASAPRPDVAPKVPHDHEHPRGPATKHASDAELVCPMHPEVTATAPGLCPKCNMKLVPKK